MKLRITGLLLIAASTMLTTACGQKGPLYMPRDESTATQPAPLAGKAAEGAEKPSPDMRKEDEKDSGAR